jgi:hypothetical protein
MAGTSQLPNHTADSDVFTDESPSVFAALRTLLVVFQSSRGGSKLDDPHRRSYLQSMSLGTFTP